MPGQHCPWSPIILDPFAGQGTTLAAADGLYDEAIGIELDPERAEIARTWK